MAIFSRLKRAKTPKTDCEVVTFSRLDYWSMLDLFDRLPLHDLVRLTGLASWWSGYLNKVCIIKRSITVKYEDKSEPSITDYDTQDQFNLFKVTRIDSHVSDRLGRLLPSITTLEIIIVGLMSHDIDDITYLINQWSHQLVCLKLKCLNSVYSFIAQDPAKMQIQINQLLLSLNTFTSLRRLTIDCKSWACVRGMELTIELSILSQLDYFYFDSHFDDFENLRPSLVRYAEPNHNLKQIELPSLVWFRPNLVPMDDLLREHQPLLSKFTMLNHGHDHQLTRDEWVLFPNLTSVDLNHVKWRSTFMDIINSMQDLKLVRILKLYVEPYDFGRGEFPDELPQLPSVINLELTFSAKLAANSYPTFKSLKLGAIFPNVKSVHLEYIFECTSSSHRVVMWMAKIWSKISYRMFKLRVQRELPGVKCTFKTHYFY